MTPWKSSFLYVERPWPQIPNVKSISDCSPIGRLRRPTSPSSFCVFFSLVGNLYINKLYYGPTCDEDRTRTIVMAGGIPNQAIGASVGVLIYSAVCFTLCVLVFCLLLSYGERGSCESNTYNLKKTPKLIYQISHSWLSSRPWAHWDL